MCIYMYIVADDAIDRCRSAGNFRRSFLCCGREKIRGSKGFMDGAVGSALLAEEYSKSQVAAERV